MQDEKHKCIIDCKLLFRKLSIKEVFFGEIYRAILLCSNSYNLNVISHEISNFKESMCINISFCA
jgi:hypothetical protein